MNVCPDSFLREETVYVARTTELPTEEGTVGAAKLDIEGERTGLEMFAVEAMKEGLDFSLVQEGDVVGTAYYGDDGFLALSIRNQYSTVEKKEAPQPAD